MLFVLDPMFKDFWVGVVFQGVLGSCSWNSCLLSVCWVYAVCSCQRVSGVDLFC